MRTLQIKECWPYNWNCWTWNQRRIPWNIWWNKTTYPDNYFQTGCRWNNPWRIWKRNNWFLLSRYRRKDRSCFNKSRRRKIRCKLWSCTGNTYQRDALYVWLWTDTVWRSKTCNRLYRRPWWNQQTVNRRIRYSGRLLCNRCYNRFCSNQRWYWIWTDSLLIWPW